jgi:copper homeostasis protein
VQRVELCAKGSLAFGGTTPSAAEIVEAVILASNNGATVASMVRVRGGDFYYNAEEIEQMVQQIDIAAQNGATDVVFGALTSQNALDLENVEKLKKRADANGLGAVFHMAFDQIDMKSQVGALKNITRLGFKRILTHGGESNSDVFDNLEHLSELAFNAQLFNIEYNANLQILVGGGVTHANLITLKEALDEMLKNTFWARSRMFGKGGGWTLALELPTVDQFHGTRIVDVAV